LRDDDGVARDNDALDRFLASVERHAFRHAVLAAGCRDEALDIVQDAMLRLVRCYGERNADEWGPLFHSVLQSAINDWRRRHWVRSRWRQFLGRADDEEGDDPLENVLDPAASEPSRQLAGDDIATALDAALQQLPGRQRQAVLLRLWEGFDVATTAQAMACSEGSVKTHYSRGIHTLREILGEHWP
jgi:RNA polymerase sigma-70 factor (ECF subfamily)